MSSENSAWYVIRTKQYKERIVKHGASLLVEDIYLPLLRTKRSCLGKLMERTEPLFPCYLFARFRLSEARYRLMHTPGITGIICAGSEPCEVDASIVLGIKGRETDGVVVLKPQTLQPRQRVIITEGAFCGIEAIFERYLSGAERVAVLLNSIGRGDTRANLRVGTIAPIASRGVV